MECGGPALAASAGSLAERFATARPFAASSAAAARHVDAPTLASGPRGSSSLPRGALPGVGLGASPFARRSAGVLLGAELASQTRHASGGRGWFGLGGGATTPTDAPDTSTAATSSAVADVADVPDAASAASSSLGATLADPSALGEVAAIAGDSWWTTSALMYVIEYFHLTHGMEWWHAIVATTLIMRVVTIPLTVVQQRNAARLHLAKPEIEAINKLAKENSHDQAAMERYQAEIWKIWAKYDCNPAKMFAPLVVQAPVFISFFFAIRNMSAGVPSFKTGGDLWFHDLSVADPTYILPLLSSATFLVSVETNPPSGGQGNADNPGMRWGMRALAAAMVPLTASFPQGVFVYWVTTNVFSFAQAQALKIPALKSLAGIPEVGNTKVNAAAASTLGGKRAIEQKFGAAPATHAGNPKVRPGCSSRGARLARDPSSRVVFFFFLGATFVGGSDARSLSARSALSREIAAAAAAVDLGSRSPPRE